MSDIHWDKFAGLASGLMPKQAGRTRKTVEPIRIGCYGWTAVCQTSSTDDWVNQSGLAELVVTAVFVASCRGKLSCSEVTWPKNGTVPLYWSRGRSSSSRHRDRVTLHNRQAVSKRSQQQAFWTASVRWCRAQRQYLQADCVGISQHCRQTKGSG